ncbi:MAG TPA: hypothetical protein VMV10_00725, partial [Pirellulales bacterium]|nr:hypothetical protein [Pirellulales bacterium]
HNPTQPCTPRFSTACRAGSFPADLPRAASSGSAFTLETGSDFPLGPTGGRRCAEIGVNSGFGKG